MSPELQHHGLSRRGLLRASALAGATAAGLGASPAMAGPRPPAATAGAARTGFPTAEFGGPGGPALGAAYRAAVTNLTETNTVPYDPGTYDRTGLLSDPPGTFVRAGGGYEQPWTRDASVNSWNAASLLMPAEARNTLWAVCERRADGGLVVQQDDQWWDQAVWAVAAWDHYALTADRDFLRLAYEAAANTLDADRAAHFNDRYGLYEGPAFMQDGIAGYPSPPYDPDNGSSFVLDHPGSDRMMSLSTNCVVYGAQLAAARMAGALGRHAEAAGWLARAARLRTAVGRHLWRPEAGTYGYFVHGTGERAGRLEHYQEGNGLAFAVLFGIASGRRARSVLDTTHHEPHGVVNVWPHFARFDDAHPGRHNAVVWPMTVGMWGHAAAVGGRTDLLGRALEDLAELAGRDGHFWEIYHARTGEEDGGWQTGTHWPSQPDQTWSATGYLRLVHRGLFGLTPRPDGLAFTPRLPRGWGTVRLTGLRWRDATLDITLARGGHGHSATMALDGHRVGRVPSGLRGHHQVDLRVP
ncbi:MGH1-like glycoside hydrolase domain-containing protein [Streptomyces sp. NPDC050560]|uniref:MGH1-like glycoside hydrolase domain-containing protein n=1 Tax=Streptomyces sp. NPDC050560 TaxID=3365630 RepID=UPI0037AC793A